MISRLKFWQSLTLVGLMGLGIAAPGCRATEKAALQVGAEPVPMLQGPSLANSAGGSGNGGAYGGGGHRRYFELAPGYTCVSPDGELHQTDFRAEITLSDNPSAAATLLHDSCASSSEGRLLESSSLPLSRSGDLLGFGARILDADDDVVSAPSRTVLWCRFQINSATIGDAAIRTSAEDGGLQASLELPNTLIRPFPVAHKQIGSHLYHFAAGFLLDTDLASADEIGIFVGTYEVIIDGEATILPARCRYGGPP